MMPRYLTPPKVSLLILTFVYCDGLVAPDITIRVLDFLTAQLAPLPWAAQKLSAGTGTTPSAPFAIPIEAFKKVLLGAESANHQNAWENFRQRSRDIGDIDALFNFFETLDSLFSTRDAPQRKSEEVNVTHSTVLSKTSLIGRFVRKSQLEFERLQFDDVMALQRSFELYCKPLLSMGNDFSSPGLDSSIRKLNEKSGGRAFAAINRAVDDDRTNPGHLSMHDAHTLFEFQIEEMQKHGTRLPKSMTEHFYELIGSSAEKSCNLSHYYRFLDAWYAGDYPTSFENLHRYYDYSTQNHDRSHYQYALLNRAILQADFGCFSEAIAAINETIATARENKDMPCLNFSLSWLYHFRSISGGEGHMVEKWMLGSEQKSLEYLKAKAKETNMWTLLSSTLLNEAKLYIGKGDPPRVALERVMEASCLHAFHGVDDVAASQLLVQSSLFGRLGITTLSSSYSNLVSDCYGVESSKQETLRARCQLGYTMILTGAYDAALKWINSVPTTIRRTLKFEQHLATLARFVKLKRALHNANLDSAENLLESLKTAPYHDTDLAFQISMAEIDYFMRRRFFSLAFTSIEALALKCQRQNSDIHERIKLLTAKVLLFAQCGRPEKGLSLALRAATAAHRSKTMYCLWEAIGALGIVLNGLGEHDVANSMLEAVVYQAQETEDVALIAMLQSAIADSCMGLAGRHRDEPVKQSPLLQEALRWVRGACQSYQQVEDVVYEKEMKVKVAIILRLLGRDDEAAEVV